MNHCGTTTIETQRLILRPITLDDAQDLYELLSDEKVLKYLTGIPKYTGVDMAISYIGDKLSEKYSKNDYYDWGIEEKSTGKMIGRITVYRLDDFRRMADLIWYLSSTAHGKGYMTEAAQSIVSHLQSIGFERIEAFADVENQASMRVMQKIGMQYEGTLRKYDCRRDESLYDAAMYSIVE